jgi:hypothetical protein
MDHKPFLKFDLQEYLLNELPLASASGYYLLEITGFSQKC